MADGGGGGSFLINPTSLNVCYVIRYLGTWGKIALRFGGVGVVLGISDKGGSFPPKLFETGDFVLRSFFCFFFFLLSFGSDLTFYNTYIYIHSYVTILSRLVKAEKDPLYGPFIMYTYGYTVTLNPIACNVVIQDFGHRRSNSENFPWVRPARVACAWSWSSHAGGRYLLRMNKIVQNREYAVDKGDWLVLKEH